MRVELVSQKNNIPNPLKIALIPYVLTFYNFDKFIKNFLQS